MRDGNERVYQNATEFVIWGGIGPLRLYTP